MSRRAGRGCPGWLDEECPLQLDEECPGWLDEECPLQLDEGCPGWLDEECPGELDEGCPGWLDERFFAQVDEALRALSQVLSRVLDKQLFVPDGQWFARVRR